ncbi:hypothetical protein [Actinokineospora diospyrosa]|uniref:Uncharacterized protein n=1 Tax=Actinokineospora diospyrosa TaxID=103728 RepID=A0ABT1I6C5_9PSEU|nr:hypothetical protein [Actinokineospora diospyrosa]MCP2268183.1 hypothetical protein [Actinokineospora diospyrosa]
MTAAARQLPEFLLGPYQPAHLPTALAECLGQGWFVVSDWDTVTTYAIRNPQTTKGT